MNNTIKNYFVNKDKYILFVYLFLFLTPWNLIKSQVAFFSIILVIWGFFKYKVVIFEKIKILWQFKPLLLWISFVLFCLIAVFWSDSFSEGFKRVFNFHKYEMLFATALLISLNKEQALTAIKVVLMSFTAYSIFSIIIYFDLITIAGSSSLNPRGILRYSISTQYMVITFFSSLFFVFYSKLKEEKILFILAAFLSLLALLVNNGRTAQLAFLLIFFIFVVMFSMKSKKLILISLSVLIGIVFIFSQNEKMIDRFNTAVTEIKSINNDHTYSGSFGARLYFNKAGIEIIKDNFFLGMGPADNRHKLVEMEKADKEYKAVVIKHFHSEHMEILTAYGFIGYILIFSAVVLLIYKLKDKGLYFYISLSIFLTLFFVSFANKTLSLKPLNYVYVIFFILLSIIAYQSELEKKSLENSNIEV
ncbi:O-antigen ligase [Sulfurimonas sp.]|jgi:O-antigen ligase|uniref:O-antigen ligase family protein n=1 Tax=Sulfurimonas sp. TaxID=2022749 RepID=UPI0025EB9F88|nr:O-antigen ligase family protein [Sulfurimonas sp.]MBT5935566.1 O-antigen ligase family protein [Sulfurimonas sp.]